MPSNDGHHAARGERTRRVQRRNAKRRGVISEFEEEAGERLTLVRIAKRLNAAGYRTARGKGFGRATVHRLPSAELPVSCVEHVM